MAQNNDITPVLNYDGDDIEDFIQMLKPFHSNLTQLSNEYKICYTALNHQMILGQHEEDSSYYNKCNIGSVISAIRKVVDKL